ncbi:MAG: threonylcarbamoyl-AMP synthase [Candidatus Accumulibacter sp.]|jgi:L-threonylcarbamoyladenylate synthase|nr:threonylcarbamoyl-AMP synthase [Accumulibacter sp.]
MFPDYIRAVDTLRSGGLVVFPTETVYGLGADAANPEAVSAIFALKGRPAAHPLIVHLPGADYLGQWAKNIPSLAFELAEAFWPGPLTLILHRASGTPNAVTGGQDTVGVRVPAHPAALELLRMFAEAGGGHGRRCGIAAPSANRFGQVSPTCVEHVREEFGASLPFVIDGGSCALGIESTIIDLSRGEGFAPRLLRPGAISTDRIETALGARLELPRHVSGDAAPRVSGSLSSHYAPKTPMYLLPSSRLLEAFGTLSAKGKKIGVLAFSEGMKSGSGIPAASLFLLPGTPDGYARALYAGLRELDRAGYDAILAESVPGGSCWMAAADRLRRASH